MTKAKKICEHCGARYRPNKSNFRRQRFCSHACATTAFNPRTPLEKRFWPKVDMSGGEEACWLWTAGRSHRLPDAYGAIGTGGTSSMKAAHRVAYELAFGPIPAGMLVCHHCDTPLCVNPAHLFLGRPIDNIHDRDAKGRHRALIGVASPNAKLSEADVREIRYGSARSRVLADRFSISTSTVNLIRQGKRYPNVTA